MIFVWKSAKKKSSRNLRTLKILCRLNYKYKNQTTAERWFDKSMGTGFSFLPLRAERQGILLPVHSKYGETCLHPQSCRHKVCLHLFFYP